MSQPRKVEVICHGSSANSEVVIDGEHWTNVVGVSIDMGLRSYGPEVPVVTLIVRPDEVQFRALEPVDVDIHLNSESVARVFAAMPRVAVPKAAI